MEELFEIVYVPWVAVGQRPPEVIVSFRQACMVLAMRFILMVPESPFARWSRDIMGSQGG